MQRRFGSRLLLVSYRRGDASAAASFVRSTLDSRIGRLAVPGGPEAFGMTFDYLAERVVFVESEIPESPWRTWRGSVEVIALPSDAGAVPEWILAEPDGAVRIVAFPDDLPDPERPDRALIEMRDSWPLSTIVAAARPWHS